MADRIFEALAWGFAVGILGVVYRYILAKEEAFNKWWQFGARYEGKWFFKPVWGCSHCFAGQVALWSYTILKILPAMIKVIRAKGWLSVYSIQYLPQGLTALFCLILTISAAIFTAKTISFIFEKQGL